MSDLVAQLKADLTQAMRAGERSTVSVLRTALAAIANAEALPVTDEVSAKQTATASLAGSVAGAGATDVPRRVLTEGDRCAVIASERDERLAVADIFHASGRVADARRLREEASVLERYLGSHVAEDVEPGARDVDP